jgi:polyhydroxyalkanoate synthesis regulator phasin
MNKKTTITLIAVGVMTVSLMGASSVNAQTKTTPSLVDMIVQKFGLDKTQVQTLVDQFRTQRKSTMEAHRDSRIEDRLSTLVKDGKITEAQKQAILTKLATERAKHSAEELKNMTPQERNEAFQSEVSDLKTWATSQGIDPKYMMVGGGRMGFLRK